MFIEADNTPPNIFMSSDWHLGHTNITTYEKCRPINFGKVIMANWRAIVNPKDTVYLLGDIFFNKTGYREFAEEFFELPGHKILIKGNHDHLTNKAYEDVGFEEIVEDYQLLVTSVGGVSPDHRFLLSHFPLVCHDGRYAKEIEQLIENFKKFNCNINVHGHTHSKNMPNKECINVSVEVCEFRPISIKEIVERWIKKNENT